MEENNKLIAEFIGRKGKHNPNLYTFKGSYKLLDDDVWYTLEQAKFHKSWDWLKPVIDKIWEKGFAIDKQLHDPIEEVYEIVVNMIKWLNKNRPNE